VRPGIEPGQAPDDTAGVGADGVLNAMTNGVAWGCFQDQRRGRLMPGYTCDMTVLSADPLRARPDELLKARVQLVVINGAVAWRPR
jgi:predicted amidohydrolase YtcJ